MELKKLLDNFKKEIPHKWKIQVKPKTNKNGVCVAYIDARDCMDMLDEFCEEWWQSEFYEVKWKVFCKVWIKINWEWQFRSDSGALESSDNVEEETTSKWETSDAFKRACVQWGIGRFLYEKDMVYISEKEYNANQYKITEFCNKWRSKVKQETKQENAKLREIIEEIKKATTEENLKELYYKAKEFAEDNTEKSWLNTVVTQKKSEFV